MNYSSKTLGNHLLILIPVLILGCTAEKEAYYTESDFQKVDKSDVHVHIFTENSDFMEQAMNDNFKVVNIALDARNEMGRVKTQFQYCLVQKKNTLPRLRLRLLFQWKAGMNRIGSKKIWHGLIRVLIVGPSR